MRNIIIPDVQAGQTADLIQIRFDQFKRDGRIGFTCRRVAGTFEIKLGPSVIATVHLTRSADFFRLQNILPTAGISVNGEGAGSAAATPDAQFAGLQRLARLRAVDEKVGVLVSVLD